MVPWIRFYLILIILASYTVYKAIDLLPSHFLAMFVAGVGVFLFILSWQFLHRWKPQVSTHKWFRILSFMASFTMGFWATFILLSIPLDLLKVFGFFPKMVSTSLTQGIFLISLVISLLGLIQALLGPKIKEVHIEVSELPIPFTGLKILQISDLHVGPIIQERYVQKVVEMANGQNPDLIFLTGDLVDAEIENVGDALRPLSQLKARSGSFYVTGNHEYYWGAKNIIAKVESLGLKPLINQSMVIEKEGDRVAIIGVTDLAGEHFFEDHRTDLAQALRTVNKEDFKILLSHRPDLFKEADENGVHLQLSGHTHSGQFFPFSLFMPLAHKYYRGLHRHGRLWLYVNIGTGFWGPINRFAYPAEMTLITLT